MDTKWKKSKMIIGLVTMFAGLSLLFGCAVFNPAVAMGNITDLAVIADPNGSWEQTSDFRQEAAMFLNDMIRIGAGQPPSYGACYETSYGSGSLLDALSGRWSVTETRVSAIVIQGTAVESAAADAVVTEGEFSAETAQTQDFAEEETEWTPEEIRKMAENFHESHKEDRNILYELKKDGKVLYENRGEQTIGGPKNSLPEGYDLLIKYDGQKVTLYRDGKKLDVYGDGIYESDGKHWRVPGYENYKVPKDWERCEVTLAVRSVPMCYTVGDTTYGKEMYWIRSNFRADRQFFYIWCALAATGLVLLVLSHFFKKERREAEKALGIFLGKIPVEIRLAAILFLLFFNVGFIIADIFLAFWLLRLVYLDLRYGAKSWKNSLLLRLARFMETKDMKLPVQERLAEQSFRPIILMPVSLILVLLSFLDEEYWGLGIEGILLVLAALCFAALAGVLLYNAGRQKRLAVDLGCLSDQIDAVYEGRMRDACELPADSDLAEMAEKVAGIQNGLETALEERMKSERMKVELVANVSHDIKTPLTSIISYVDLLKEEKNLPDYLQDYVEILAQKSERLKTMVQDIFEVSKAASGQLPVKMEILDLGKLLRQTLADMEEQIEAAPVNIRSQIPQEPVLILADGQRMYRVFQNLVQNALQYSLEGSRIYLTLEKQGSLAVASVRNTSAAELNGNADFTERFVRGDKSRTDGGSGLGLSIAKSFTEACGGSFKVETIADLFVVRVEFTQQ